MINIHSAYSTDYYLNFTTFQVLWVLEHSLPQTQFLLLEYHIKGISFKACVQSVLTYGIETWATKAEICIAWIEQSLYDGEVDVWSVSEG